MGRNYVLEQASKDPGMPLPYHLKMGLTRAEYAEFLALSDRQQLGVVSTFPLTLERSGDWV